MSDQLQNTSPYNAPTLSPEAVVEKVKDDFAAAADALDQSDSETGTQTNDASAPTSDPAGVKQGPPPEDGHKESVEQAKEEDDAASEEMVVTARRSLPKLRSFSDQTFVLMHMINLINLRNEKFKTAQERLDTGYDGSNAVESSLNKFLKRIKGENPYPYYATENLGNELERNAALFCYGEPYSFLNYITARPGYQDYIDISTDKLSTLTSKIRFFKVFNSEGKEDVVEVVFDTAGMGGAELEDLLKNGSKRGYGAGIKSFDVSLDGVNPYTRERSVSATLVIYASSMDDLLKPRRGRTTTDDAGRPVSLFYKYFDLAMKTDTTASDFAEPDSDGSFGALDDLDFKIIAQVGINENSSATSVRRELSSISLNLGPITHAYDIAEDGSITLTIDYKGHIEKEYTNPLAYDVFSTSESLKNDLRKSLGVVVLKDVCGTKEAKKFERHELARGNEDLVARAKLLTDALRQKGKIYYVRITPELFQSYNQAFNTFEKALEEADTDSDTKEAEESKKKAVDRAVEKLREALGFQATAVKKKKTIEENISTLENNGEEAQNIEEDMEEPKEKAFMSYEESLNVKDCAIDPNSTQVSFFYAGDLINLILQQLSAVYSKDNLNKIINDAWNETTESEYLQEALSTGEGKDKKSGEIPAATMAKLDLITQRYSARAERFKKFRVVLGPTIFKDFFTAQQILCSIGDIPIPLNHFNAWLANQVEGKKKYRIGLVDFLREFLTTYVRSMLKGDSEIDQGILGQLKLYDSLPLVGYTPPSEPGTPPDQLNALRVNYGGRKGLHYQTVPQDYRPLINTYKDAVDIKSNLRAHDYLVFFEKAATPALNFDTPASRTQFGIHTYQHGRDRGIFKKASFKRTNIKGLKEARFQAGQFNGLKQLTEVFDVTLETYADLAKFPGQRIYLDSKSLVPFLSQETRDSLNGYSIEDFGLGGFYVTQQVKHSFAPGKFDTTIIAKWEGWPRNRKKIAKPEVLEYGETIGNPMEGVRAWLASQNSSAQPDKPEQSPNCKSSEAPGTGGADEIYDAIVDTVESMFGEGLGSMAETVIGYIKGLFDTSDNGNAPDEIDVGAAFQADVNARKAGLNPDNPDEGTSSSANNGPATTTISGVASASFPGGN